MTMMLLQQRIQNPILKTTSRVSSSHSPVYVYSKDNSFGAKALLIIKRSTNKHKNNNNNNNDKYIELLQKLKKNTFIMNLNTSSNQYIH